MASIQGPSGLATALCLLLLAAPAFGEPGDEEAVAQARQDYAEAMKGHDIGLQNAMRAELAAQLAMSKKRSTHKETAKKTHRAHRDKPGR